MSPMRRAVVRRRPLLRAAAVGGGAYLAGRAMARPSAAPEQAPPAAPAPTPAPPGSSRLDQLDQLSALHERGTLTDEEFTAAKARLG